MYKLDLTVEVVATGIVRNPNTNEKEGVNVTTPISNFVTQALNNSRPGKFEEAKRLKDLIQKVETNKPIEVTEDEMKVIFNIFQGTEINTMLAFASMAESLNKDFDIIKYEDSVKNLRTHRPF